LSYDMFEEMSNNIQLDTIRGLFNVRLETPPEREQVVKEVSTNVESTEKKTIQRKESKIGRNDPCPCGSGKKYKQCCGKK
jgi:Preprotein translocase subunit SecA (ATPase, RNA helicase)